MTAIYLGPWLQEKNSIVAGVIGKSETCHYRPLLIKKFNGIWLARPEIWFDENKRKHCMIISYIDDHWQYGELEDLQKDIDDNLLTRGWGLGESAVVLLDQEKFDKLSVLI